MKKVYPAIIIIVIALVFAVSLAVGIYDSINREEPVAAEVALKTEMIDSALIYYIGEITWGLVTANREDHGSFEQRSELQATSAKINANVEEIKSIYENDLPVVLSLLRLAEWNQDAIEEALSGDKKALMEGILVAEEVLAEIENEHLEGTLPIMFKHMAVY